MSELDEMKALRAFAMLDDVVTRAKKAWNAAPDDSSCNCYMYEAVNYLDLAKRRCAGLAAKEETKDEAG